ncbi:hypothetical protein [Sorangium sp. So ce1151]|uniref:hypothetical protein n=1 Tax=Sorangium sp. So ce1151 TaxID=3133332 RepID=UPI003F6275EA
MGELQAKAFQQKSGSLSRLRDKFAATLGRTRQMQPPSQLSQSEIQAAVHLTSATLIKEVYDISVRQVQSEGARQVIIDGKASTLLGAVGLSLTLSLALASQLLSSQSLHYMFKQVLAVILVVGTLCALLAAAHALMAVRITEKYRTLNEKDVFNRDILYTANAEEGDDGPASYYRRYLIPQIWRIAQLDSDIHERKARLVANGQRWFFGFVFCIAAIGAIVAAKALAD